MVSFGEHKTLEIVILNTVEVLIFIPNGPYISAHSERGSVTQQQRRQVLEMVDYGPQIPMNTNTTVATAVQRRWTCHTRTVLPADAYGRQRRNVLSACSVVYLWYMSGLCAHERATKTGKKLPVRTSKIRPHTEKPGKSSYPLPPEKKKK